MTSRELLDKILQSTITKAVGGCFMKNDELETIKKDLDRLEKENKELKRLNKNLKNSNTHKDTYASKLKGENERLQKIIKIKEELENDN